MKRREVGARDFLSLRLRDESAWNIWFHVASLGEFRQAEPLLKRLKKLPRKVNTTVTFFSPSGHDIISDANPDYIDNIGYLPLDTEQNARKTFKAIVPDLVVFVRYERWINHLDFLHKNDVPLWLINATAPQANFSNFLLSKLNTEIFNCFSRIYPVSQNAYAQFQDLGIETYRHKYDSRYDGIKEKVESSLINEDLKQRLDKLAGERLKIIVGSGWPEDDKYILPVLKRYSQKLFIIYAPHEINKSHLNQLSRVFKSEFLTEIEEGKKSDMLIIDRIGLLQDLYSISDIAYVGGGFGKGVHSLGEPFGHGVPIASGKPASGKSPETDMLVEIGALTLVKNQQEFEDWIEKSLSDSYRKGVKEKSKLIFDKLTGSSDYFITEIEKLLSI
ncbi:MAG: glycosyltransferase N-terminal domain-containing protein [Candidatus Kapaibacteriales bacterium]